MNFKNKYTEYEKEKFKTSFCDWNDVLEECLEKDDKIKRVFQEVIKNGWHDFYSVQEDEREVVEISLKDFEEAKGEREEYKSESSSEWKEAKCINNHTCEERITVGMTYLVKESESSTKSMFVVIDKYGAEFWCDRNRFDEPTEVQ